jgi:thiol-disulfide isomerase/thioredoxin
MERYEGDIVSEGRLADFDGATGWLNTEPLTRDGLRGKVVLVDFWTFTCINWLRTLSYVRAWAEKYADYGLVTIGVHTPEFPFEADRANVERAVAEMRIGYPVALDPDYAVWQTFGNHYWPALYLADAEGKIQYHVFGEGGYDESERFIQKLLREAGATDVPDDPVPPVLEGVEAQADWDDLRSPESYVGAQQGRNFASPSPAVFDQPHRYTAPDSLMLNSWALSGDWTIGDGDIMVNEAGGGIRYRFHARDVNLVLRPSAADVAVPFRVLLDGAAPGAAHGVNVDEAGRGSVSEGRLYQLIRQPGAIEDRTVEIVFDEPGAEAYVFTFG